jgi:hypothetical protein
MDEFYDPYFLCTYKQHNDDDLYRIQFLQAFKLDNWDNDKVRHRMDQLYDHIGYHFKDIYIKLKTEKSCLSHIILFLGQNINCIDLFQSLFCMDVFQEFHLCISDIFRIGKIEEEHYLLLKKTIFS